jgi:C4-dicarboxylate-specific signal transduction histidine kinase
MVNAALSTKKSAKAKRDALGDRENLPQLSDLDQPLGISARDVVDAALLPAAIYANDGHAICTNASFDAEFLAQELAIGINSTTVNKTPSTSGWIALQKQLDAAPSKLTELPNDAEYYCPKRKRWYRLHHRFVRTKQPTLHLVLLQDITERMDALNLEKTQHEKLLLTSRMMSVGEMTTTLAHELNQPLASIVNYLSTALKLAERIENPPARLKDALNLGRQQAERAAHVIQRLREFVRTREPKRTALRLRESALQVMRMLDLEIKKFHVITTVEIPDDFPEVFADRVMIEQVSFNLVKNALEAMRTVPPAQRQLLITARVTLDGDAELRVIDRGAGLEANQEQQIFSPFFTTKSDGMGIGLSICRSIIEYHQGRIFFEANPAGGAIFGFRLPIPTDAEPIRLVANP